MSERPDPGQSERALRVLAMQVEGIAQRIGLIPVQGDDAATMRRAVEVIRDASDVEDEVKELRKALALQTANCQRLIDRVAELGGFTDVPAKSRQQGDSPT